MLDGINQLTKQHDLEGLTRVVHQMVQPKTGCAALVLYVLHHKLVKGVECYMRVTCVGQDREVLTDTIPVKRSLVSNVMDTGKTLNVVNAQTNTTYNPKVDRPYGLSQVSGLMLGVPILDENDNISGVVIQYDNNTGKAFEATDEEYMKSLASMVDVVVKNVERANRGEHEVEIMRGKMLDLQDELNRNKEKNEIREEKQREKDLREKAHHTAEDERALVEEREAVRQSLADQDAELAQEKADVKAAGLVGMPVDLHSKLKKTEYIEFLQSFGEFCGVQEMEEFDASSMEKFVRHVKGLVESGIQYDKENMYEPKSPKSGSSSSGSGSDDSSSDDDD